MANLEILLSKKPQPGQQQLSEVFQLKYGPIPQEQQLQEGQVLVENLYISIDAAMRIWINGARTYVDGVKPGQIMVGRTVSKVIASKSPKFLQGDTVSGFLRWTQFEIVQGKDLKLLKRGDLDETSSLHSIGPLDISGLTAYVGFETIGKPKENETIVVSAASGGVGEIAIQLAKYYYKCRVIGIAGGQEKCNYVKKALGADDCIDYTQKNLNQRLKESCPNGINIYFDNVGGEILDEVLMHIVDQTRVILCGAVSTYNASEQYKIKNYPRLIIKRAVMQGFIYFDYPQLFKPGQEVISKMIKEGQMKIRYDIQNGLDEAPNALQRLLTGKNNGKVIVRVQKQEKSKL